jgi:hypothetical protein
MHRMSCLRALFVMTSLTCGACSTSIVMNPAGAEINPKRLLAIPSSGVEYGFDFSGNQELDKDATKAALANVNTSINYSVSASGGRFFPNPALADLDGYLAFRHWSELVLKDVMMAALGRLRDPPPSVDDWYYRSDIQSWREPLAADYLLITLFIDGHDSAGRAIAVAFAGGWTAGHRMTTCAVRLRDGRLVWCKVDLNMGANITTREGAQHVVDGLLTEMLATASLTPHPAPQAATPPRQPAPPPAAESNEPPAAQPVQDQKPAKQQQDEETAP